MAEFNAEVLRAPLGYLSGRAYHHIDAYRILWVKVLDCVYVGCDGRITVPGIIERFVPVGGPELAVIERDIARRAGVRREAALLARNGFGAKAGR